MEIERKFLVHNLPEDLERFPCKRMEQAYISTAPVIRVRRSDEDYILTCKGRGFLSREEHELQLTEREYRSLLTKTEGAVISKNRYLIPWKAHTVELDVFDAPFAPLMLAEVEFSSEEEALNFEMPDWFGEEVTYDSSYTNAALSRRGMEKTEVRPGRYRHFKGNEYQVLSVARHSETQEPMVVYQALYGDRGVWVRPAAMWNESVIRDGVEQPRFVFVEE